MTWVKVEEWNKSDLLTKGPDELFQWTRVVARYKAQPDGIILLFSDFDQLIQMIDDTVPDDAIFEIWMPAEPPSYDLLS